MIKIETIEINGKKYIRTYSDNNVMIERDGALYEDAVDPIGSGRSYIETEHPIPDRDVTESDYLTALERLGVQ